MRNKILLPTLVLVVLGTVSPFLFAQDFKSEWLQDSVQTYLSEDNFFTAGDACDDVATHIGTTATIPSRVFQQVILSEYTGDDEIDLSGTCNLVLQYHDDAFTFPLGRRDYLIVDDTGTWQCGLSGPYDSDEYLSCVFDPESDTLLPDFANWLIDEPENECLEVEGDIAISGYYNYPSAHDLLSPVIACIDNCRVTLFGSRTPNIQVLQEGTLEYFSATLFYFNTPGQACSTPEPPELITELPGHTCAEGFEVTLLNNELFCTLTSTGEPDPTTPPIPVKPTPTPGTPGIPVALPGSPIPDQPSPIPATPGIVVDDFDEPDEVSNTTPETPSFCSQHPDSPICLVSTYSGAGQCTTQPTCAGDAVQCAIALETWKSACLAESESENFSEIADTYEDFTDADANELFGNSVTLEGWAQGIEYDLESQIAGYEPEYDASCPDDITVDGFDGAYFSMPAFDIPMQPVCDIGDILRPFILIFGYLSIGGIYYRAFVINT